MRVVTDPASDLLSSTEPLVQTHDLVMFDLDGVVYISGQAVPGAAEQIAGARAAGSHVAFVTNNAARTPDRVATHLTELGIRADREDVVTSAQAAARVLADRYGEGAVVLVLGAEGLWEAVREAGLAPVAAGTAEVAEREGDVAVALVTGYGPEVVWKDLMRAATRVRGGLPWIASNADMTIPTDYGIAPGHGVQVTMLRDFTGVEPQIAGKPSRPLLDETVRRVGGERPLMVGDRLDTDIEGATVVEVPSLLVLTGVSGLAELVAARPRERPSYLHTDLRGLHEPHPQVQWAGSVAECGGWRSEVRDNDLQVRGTGSTADWWRTVASAAWRHLDRTGTPTDHQRLDPPPPDGEPTAGDVAG